MIATEKTVGYSESPREGSRTDYRKTPREAQDQSGQKEGRRPGSKSPYYAVYEKEQVRQGERIQGEFLWIISAGSGAQGCPQFSSS